jgi:hypothetical protein
MMRFVCDRDRERPCESAANVTAALGPTESPPGQVPDFPSPRDVAEEAAGRAALLAPGLGVDDVGLPGRDAVRWMYRQVIDNIGLTLADILRYESGARPVYEKAAQRLRDLRASAGGRPIVAVGYSLGGIILVDALRYLKSLDEQPVSLLVTMGSQAPALRAFGASASAPPDDPTPDLFSPWLNIWHEDDYLSYPAGAIFGNVPDVCDRCA